MIHELLLPVRPLVPEPPPTGVTLTRTSGTALTVAWTNGDSKATTQVWRDGALLGTVAAGSSSYGDTGLTAGVLYNYQLRHLYSGVYSPLTAIKVGYTQPATPLYLIASPSGSTVTLYWTNPNSSLQTQVYRGGSLVTTVGSGVATYNDTGLSDATYAYTLKAYDGTLTSDATATVYATVDASLHAPTGLSASVSGSTVNLSWTNYNGTWQVRVYRDGTLVTTLAATTTTYADTGVANGTYSYTVRHYDGSTTSPDSTSASATVATFDYATPTGVTATTPTYCNQVSLAWTNGVTQPVEISRDDGSGYTVIATTSAGATSYLDNGVEKSHAYSYKLRHVNSPHISDYTTPVSVTTPAPSFASVSVTASVKGNKFTVGYSLSKPPRYSRVDLVHLTTNTGLDSDYGPSSGIGDPTDFPVGTAYTITVDGPSDGVVTLGSMKLYDTVSFPYVLVASSGTATATFKYDPGTP